MSSKSLAEILRISDEIAQSIVAPRAAAVDVEARWPETGLRALLAAGLGGLVLPRQVGGLGHGLVALAQVCERLGRECASTAICYGMHSVAAAVISAKATTAQKALFLEPIASGQHLTTLSLSESGSGSHFYIPGTSLELAAGGFQVKGEKSFVTNGGHADSYVVSTRASNPEAGPGDFSCVVVPANAEGLSWGPAWNGAGMRGNSARTMRLDGVQLTREALLGEEGDEIWYVFNVVAPYFLVAMAGTYLGVAVSAFEEARRHLGARRYAHSGATLADQSVLQHRLGSLWAKLERTRTLLLDAAAKGDAVDPLAIASLCSAKAEVADCAVDVTNEALTLVGGKGYSEATSPLMRYLRDARAAHVMAPTTDILRTWTGRALLGLPILGD